LQLQPFLDDVVEYVDEGVLAEPRVDFVELEVEGGEALGDFGDEGVGSLLVFLVGRDEVVVEAEWGAAYGF